MLVDFENRPVDDLSALTGHPVVVILFLGQKSRIKKALVEQIETLPFEVRLIKVGVTKKNAADFVLTYHLGAIMARNPGERYYVVSGDDDFDPVITHLTANHHPVSQHPDLASLPFLAKKKSTAKSKPSTAPAVPVAPVARTAAIEKTALEKRCEGVIARLNNPNRSNRPGTRKSLIRHLRASLGKEASEANVDALFQRLTEQNVVKIDENEKVVYPAG